MNARSGTDCLFYSNKNVLKDANESKMFSMVFGIRTAKAAMLILQYLKANYCGLARYLQSTTFTDIRTKILTGLNY